MKRYLNPALVVKDKTVGNTDLSPTFEVQDVPIKTVNSDLTSGLRLYSETRQHGTVISGLLLWSETRQQGTVISGLRLWSETDGEDEWPTRNE